MYIQDMFRESELGSLHAFMRAHALATIVVPTPQPEAFLMPIEIVSDGEKGLLRGHANRASHLCSKTASDATALAIFQGPNAYISPRWYVNGQSSGRVAPSWNFATVHASGPIRFVDDAQWLRAHLTALTEAQESHRANPWQLSEAPTDFVDGLLKHLIGLEIEITHLEGKRFLSQQRTPADRTSLVYHLRKESRGAAHDVAALIESIDANRELDENIPR